ncbi:transporter substrate-binding domain-containing protein [Microbacterium betulae]|uniref:Transporter substrate-binding domain-containing protein n=1 Tax=Microbacterium betulae TaxID=2981139 RepID=A0AA97I546_9MICO|nr:transporter substrate-binding domain-containing protein [Microbacterium sp. AB]WOF23311.1 transporter substrate-binding domain-containing protein [Microbacterium sp. AB]
MNKRLTATAPFVVLSLGVALAGCASEDTTADAVADDCTPAHADLPTIAEGTLTIGISDMPPLVTPTGEDGYEGLDADIVNGFAALECLTVEPVDVGATAAVTAVQQGRVDTSLGGWYRTEERSEVVALSYPMYLDGLIVAAPEAYETFDDLDGLTVGVVQGYNFVDELEALFPGRVNTYPEPTLLAEDLSAGRIDAAFDVASAAVVYGGATISSLEPDDRVRQSVLPAQTGLPFSHESEALVAAFDDYLQTIHEDGTLKEYLEKWDLDPELSDVGEPRFV